MIHIGIVGNRNFKDLELGLFGVEGFIQKLTTSRLPFIVHSGEAKSKHKGNVDRRAKLCAIEYGLPYKPHEPKINNTMTKEEKKNELFRRNGKLVAAVSILACFINKRQWRSGTFNTINQFTASNKWDFIIFNEFNKVWPLRDLPTWLKNRIHNNHKDYPTPIQPLWSII